MNALDGAIALLGLDGSTRGEAVVGFDAPTGHLVVVGAERAQDALGSRWPLTFDVLGVRAQILFYGSAILRKPEDPDQRARADDDQVFHDRLTRSVALQRGEQP